MTAQSITDFAANYVKAQEEASASMVNSIMRFGKTTEENAITVFNFWLKKKWLKFDHMNRSYTVRSGNMLSTRFITDSLEIAITKKSKKVSK